MVELLCGLPTIYDICRFYSWVVAKACFYVPYSNGRVANSSSLPPFPTLHFLYFLGACFNVLSIILVSSILGSWRNQALSGRGSWWISWTCGNWGTNNQSKDNRTSYRDDDCSCCCYTETARENSSNCSSSTFVKSQGETKKKKNPVVFLRFFITASCR